MCEMLYVWQLQMGDIFLHESHRFMKISCLINEQNISCILHCSTGLAEQTENWNPEIIVEKVSTTH